MSVNGEQYVIAIGNPFDGVELIGPFPSSIVAIDWASANYPGLEWNCVTLKAPTP